MDFGIFILIILIAIGIGTLASLFGIGGGFLLLPTMIMLLAMETHETVGTVAFIILFMSLSSTVAYAKQKRIDFALTGMLLAGSMLGGIIGAYTTTLVSGKFILVMFGTVEVILAIILGVKKSPEEQKQAKSNPPNGAEIPIPPHKWYILNRKNIDAMGTVYNYRSNLLLAIPLSFLAGFLSSLLGIGGGTIYIQIFVFVCGMSIHMAIASSMFMIFVTSITNTISFAVLGQINYPVGIAFAIGMVLGAQIGAYISKKLHSKYLKPLAAIMISFIAIRMIYFALVQN
jgi:uncharacterized membrane protein YfcA